MAPDKINRDSETFTKRQLQIEILKQELKESHDRLRSQSARLRRQYSKEHEEERARGQSPTTAFDRIQEKLLPVLEQRKQIRAQKARLQVILMREAWRQAKNLPEKAATIRKWALYWFRPDFRGKMRSSVELWALRTIIKLRNRLRR